MIKILVDKIRVSGPKVDGTFTVSFDVGEYERENIAKIVILEEAVYEIEIKEAKN